jgi:signal transduction histidine kinase/ligand-binding sensor domain-containing protein
MFQIRGAIICVAQFLVTLILWLPPAHAALINTTIKMRDVVRLPVDQSKGLAFKTITTADGLSQARVSEIVQDDLGFIWFGTEYGVNRYDGYSFKFYAHDPANPRSAAGTGVSTLFKDRDGFIWIGWANGLDRLDPTTEKYTHYFAKSGDLRNSITIAHISQDRQGIIWLATGSGLRRLDPANNSVTEFRHNTDPSSLPTDNVNWSGEDSLGRFWVGTSKGLSEFDRAHNKVLRTIPMDDPIRVGMFEDRRGELWITSKRDSGLYLFDPEKNVLTPYSFYKSGSGPIESGITGIAEGPDGSLWIASSRLGLLRLDREKKHFEHYGNPAEGPNSTTGNDIITLLLDRDNNIWTGLNSGGVNYFGSGLPQFEVFRHLPGDPNSLTRDFVNAALKDRDGTLWIGNNGGLNRIDGKTGRREIIDLGFGDVISLAQTADGVIWVGTYARGLTLYDPRKKTIEKFIHDPARPGSISNNEIHRVFVDRHQTVWIATDDGLDRFDPVTRSFITYKLQWDNRFGQNYLSIAEDAYGGLWLGTQNSGLHHFDPVSGKLEAVGEKSDLLNGFSGSWVVSLLTGRLGTLWLGTSDGLKSLDLKTGMHRAYDTRDGMPSNSVSCILEDTRGDIWMSTTKGLSEFVPETATFTNYSMIDELGGNDLTGWGGCSKSPDGEMFFGGFDGAVGFYPKVLKVAPPKTTLALTDIEIDGAEPDIGVGQSLDRAAAYAHNVVLPPGRHSLSVTFAGLNYGNSHGARYRYRLEGFDEAWHISPSSVRQATYAALPPGHYNLHIETASDRSDWQRPGISLAILVLPHWWETWWFSALCLLIFVFVSWWGVRARVQKVTREVTLQIEARNNERMRIADDLHDTLLQGLLGAAMQVSVVEDLLPADAKARPPLNRVSSLLRQLVAEGRNAVGGLRKWDFDSSDLVRAIAAVPGDLQIESAAQFRATVGGDARPLIPAARNEVYLIAREAISNALRHANASMVEVDLEYLTDSFRLKVRDDGCGFTTEAVLEKKADHFGLSVMRARAERINATLEVSSGAGAGTEITLYAPGRKIYLSKSTK